MVAEMVNKTCFGFVILFVEINVFLFVYELKKKR